MTKEMIVNTWTTEEGEYRGTAEVRGINISDQLRTRSFGPNKKEFLISYYYGDEPYLRCGLCFGSTSMEVAQTMREAAILDVAQVMATIPTEHFLANLPTFYGWGGEEKIDLS